MPFFEVNDEMKHWELERSSVGKSACPYKHTDSSVDSPEGSPLVAPSQKPGHPSTEGWGEVSSRGTLDSQPHRKASLKAVR